MALSNFIIHNFEVEGSAPGFRLACSCLSLGDIIDSNDPQTVLLFHHANGIPKELYYPIITRILVKNPGIIGVGVDARNHGDSALLNYTPDGRSRLPLHQYPPLPKQTPWIGNTPVRDADQPNDEEYVWWNSAFDLLCVLDYVMEKYGALTRILGFGHSFGGALLTAVEFLRPGTFEKLYLIEPIVFSAESMWGIDVLTNSDPKKYPHPDCARWGNPVVATTLKRKHEFDDRENARQYFLSKSFFQEWDKRCLELYINHGVYDTQSGKVALKCHPFQEAATFRGSGLPRLFAALPTIKVPCKVVSGAQTHITIPTLIDGTSGERRMKDEVIAQRLNASHMYIPNAGHMVPLQYPELIADDASTFFFESRSKL
ncbi:Alpha/Beta hydrolase protein [Cladochytrium replicatum]|nr:Alpha/Beta hydrolase protein [Cladochytrium replicatum]